MTERARNWICMTLGWVSGFAIYFLAPFDGWWRTAAAFVVALGVTWIAVLISRL